MANIKVAVRVRPISQREINVTGSDVVVHTGSREVSLTNLKVSSSKAGDSRERTRRYSFDYCFDSSDPVAENYASQERIYSTLGESVLETIFRGYNSCLVAYGQSASGKTYTMMGTKDDPGLIPRICNGIFARVAGRNETSEESFRISVSYLEVYNERVRDLLKPSTSSNGLRVREHPRLGPYVQGLTQHQVETLSSLMFRVEEGTKARKTASTLQNPTSSRSHALLTLTLEPFTSTGVASASVQTSKSSTSSNVRRQDFTHGCKLHLVDLAGSENAAACAGINRLKEGANINKSLVALGNVISALAERGNSGNNPGRRFIPYRDSALTWLLKDSLGGNATTIMLATISPASGSFNETSHTLRFAQRAQSVINRPVINEDPVAKIIRELRAEVARLKSLLLEKSIEPHTELKHPPCPCQYNQDRQDFETRCVSTSTSNSPTPDSVSSNVSLTRRHSASDSITPKSDTNTPPKCFGSLEIIENIDDTSCNLPLTNYNCARISQLIEEEVNEPVFVDIPTLVAVLIKPDDSVQSNSHQIEEICSDTVPEDSIENEFAGCVASKAIKNLDTETIEAVNHKINTNGVDHGPSFHIIESSVKSYTSRKPKLRKQQSTDSNLHGITPALAASRRYGSTETLGKRSQPPAVVQKFHPPQTAVEKRVNSDKPKKLNNIKEIDDKSDSSRREVPTKPRPNLTRKPSIDILKRRTSKDSSSSSSKEEVGSTKERRSSFVESEQLSSKPHTIIQRTRRADIVAAVTERLYSSRKTSEDSNTASTPASDIRSPENSEVKIASATRMRLQEISRKMLAKRRRICVDTQTDSASTLRLKDKGINVREPKVLRKDASVLTDRHENYDLLEPCDKVVRRVKEMSTSTTDAPDLPPVYFKDSANITDHCGNHWDTMELCQHDSGILYDDAHFDSAVEMTESSMNTNLPIEPPSSGVQTSEEDTRTCCNGTRHPSHPCQKEIKPCCPPKIITPRGDHQPLTHDHSHDEHAHDHGHDHVDDHDHSHHDESVHDHKSHEHGHQPSHAHGHDHHDHDHHDHQDHHPHHPVVKSCCPPEVHSPHKHSADDCDKSVISINLPDMINITIQSPVVLESKVKVFDGKDSRQSDTKRDTETQTDKKDALEIGTLTDEISSRPRMRDSSTTTITRPSGSQTDGRTFRIENIFQDPHGNGSTSIDIHPGISSNYYQPNNSILFTNSIGTSFTVGGRDNEKFYDPGLLSPVGRRRKSLTSEWFSKASCTWPTASRWRSQSPLGIAPRNYNSTDNYTLASNYFYKHDVNTNSPSSRNISWRENYNINVSNAVGEQRTVTKPVETKVTDKLPTLMCPSAGVTNEGLRSSSFIGMIDRKGVYEQETNFSDDSLDPKDERARRLAGDIKNVSIVKNEIEDSVNDNPCPPDVVAHTKRDSCDSLLCPEDTADFDDTDIELPRTKVSGLSADLAPVQQFKSMILGVPLVPLLLNSECDDESGLQHRSRDKKRVSFDDTNVIIEPVTSQLRDYKFAGSSRSIMKLNNPESGNEKISWKQSSESNHSTGLSFRRRTVLDCDDKSKKSSSIIEEYLDEALVFMRNINSINKCVTSGGDTNEKPQVRHRRETLEASACSPYEKCLRSMERLEQCLSRVKCHEDGLDVKRRESAEAKHGLADFRQDSQVSVSSTDDISFKYNNNYRVDRYFCRSDDTDEDESANFDFKTLDRYRRIIDTSRVKNPPKKRSRSLSSTRVSDCELDNANIYPKLVGEIDEDALIARVKKSLPSPRCTISKYDSSDESSSSDEALAAFMESIDKVSRSKDKFKYPASPRVKFLQLLSERRRIVENSRSTGAS
ncbi:uncharacterized protein LOC107036874 [Diachasma alloeum]|uniref:uncharacterized protein LOC107036874 n=1 Tax=Diachasma alloeum TaxID=454923 RepID=UPI0010FB32AD|nr:uncharacterized protein LOC107036874 [Diachasma alloeum]